MDEAAPCQTCHGREFPMRALGNSFSPPEVVHKCRIGETPFLKLVDAGGDPIFC